MIKAPVLKYTAAEKRIAIDLALLPSEDLLKLAKTQEQIECWRSNRFFNSYISDCWTALHCGKGDPLQPLLESGEINRDLHNSVWFTTYFFQSLWELTQIGFHYIQPALAQLGVEEVPSSAYDLFIFAAWEISEERFSVCLKPYHEVSTGKYVKYHKLLSKAKNGKLTPSQQKQLESFSKQGLQLWVSWFILGICEKKATSREKVLKAKLDDCLRAIDRLASCDATQMERSTSFAWKNGKTIRASKYGGTYLDA